jgi:RsiW-degrading membrane proteinase PrsW (M82 family)
VFVSIEIPVSHDFYSFTASTRYKKRMVSQQQRRAVVWTILTAILTFYYWDQLLISLNGSTFTAILVVLMAWVCGCVDMNDLTGQPHDD